MIVPGRSKDKSRHQTQLAGRRWRFISFVWQIQEGFTAGDTADTLTGFNDKKTTQVSHCIFSVNYNINLKKKIIVFQTIM